MPRIIIYLVLVLSQLACSSVVELESPSNQSSLDPGVLTARFANGFEYFLRSANGSPDNNQIEVRLIVKAGSLHETSSQRGYAHLLEHMAYRGTENFSSHDIETLLGDAGLRWGVDVNATTHYGATIFRFTLHESDAEMLPRVFDLMSEWLSSITLDADALAREKKIVEAEWRDRYAKRDYVTDPIAAVAFAGTPFAISAPVGNLESVHSATVDSLARFHRAHYRPDNAALIVTGGRQPWQLEPLIKKFFESIEVPTVPRELATDVTSDLNAPDLKVNSLSNGTAPKHISYLNTERALPELSINFIAAPLNRTLRADNVIAERFKDQLLFKVVTHLIRSRLSMTELCSSVMVETSLLESGHSIEHIKLLLTDSDVLYCLSAASHAVDSVIATELTIEEFNDFQRLFSAIAEDMASLYRNRDATKLADDLAELVINNDLPISVWELQNKLHKVVDEIDRVALNEMISQVANTHHVLYSVAGSDNALPTLQELQAATGAGNRQLTSRQRSRLVNGYFNSNQNSIEVPEIVESENPPIKITEKESYHEWRLQNGATAILIKDDRFDQVAVTAISAGGFANRDAEFSQVAKALPQFIAENGVGGYIGESLKSIKNKNSILVEPFVDPTNHGINANGRTEDLPLLLTLIEGYFQEPMIIEPGSTSLLRHLNSQKLGPQWYQSYLGSRGGKRVNELNVDSFKSIQRELFASPADFGFIFVGAVDPDELERQLSRLSYGPMRQQLINKKPTAVLTSGAEIHNVSMVNHSKSVSSVNFFMACESSLERSQYRRWNLLSDIVENRLRFLIREQQGLTYDLESDQSAVVSSVGSGYLLHQITFSAAPNSVENSISLVASELSRLHRSGITELELRRAIAREGRNRFLRNRGALSVANERAVEWLVTKNIAPIDTATVTVENINQLARCIDTANTSQVVLNSIDSFNPIQATRITDAPREQSGFQWMVIGEPTQ